VQLSSLLAHQRQSTVLTLSTSLSNGASTNGRRNTQIYFGGTGTRIESNIRQITGSAVAKLPSFARLQPYALAGGGVLVFDPKPAQESCHKKCALYSRSVCWFRHDSYAF
jgi:hypothetical protein